MIHPDLTRRGVMAGCAALGWAAPARARAVEDLPVLASRFVFPDWPGPDLMVHTFRPEAADNQSPIIFVMHGQGRNAADYRDNWIDIANRRRAIIVAPEFDKARFPRVPGYALGGLSDPVDETRFEVQTAAPIHAIEPLFDAVCARLRRTAGSYLLFGHSAGGQFAHRFAMFAHPRRAGHIVAANAGWYTVPTPMAAFPYGLAGTDLGPRDLREAFARPLTILLGREDIDPRADNLRQTSEAVAQGPHRLARGEHFHATARQEAERLGLPFAWRLAYAPGVAHDNGGIAAFAADILLGPVREAPAGGSDPAGGAG